MLGSPRLGALMDRRIHPGERDTAPSGGSSAASGATARGGASAIGGATGASETTAAATGGAAAACAATMRSTITALVPGSTRSSSHIFLRSALDFLWRLAELGAISLTKMSADADDDHADNWVLLVPPGPNKKTEVKHK